jgi:excinuclease ABC subunit C
MPDLVLIDGGSASSGAAIPRDGAPRCSTTLPVVALAKREEEIYLQGGGAGAARSARPPALQLLQRSADEAAPVRRDPAPPEASPKTLTTALLDVPGIGKATAKQLPPRPSGASRASGPPAPRNGPVCGPAAAEAIARRVRPLPVDPHAPGHIYSPRP